MKPSFSRSLIFQAAEFWTVYSALFYLLPESQLTNWIILQSFLPFPPSEVEKKKSLTCRNSSLHTSPLIGKRRTLFFAVGQLLVARFKALAVCHALAFGSQSALQRPMLLELTDFSALGKMPFDPSAHIPQPFSSAAPNVSYLTLALFAFLSTSYFSSTLVRLQQRTMITGVSSTRLQIFPEKSK